MHPYHFVTEPETSTLLHDLLIGMLWPATVLILVGLFRRQIKNLMHSITEAKIGDNVISFGHAKTDAVSPEAVRTQSKQMPHQPAVLSAVKWENVANLFWLGSDLQWTTQTALRGAAKTAILHGLTQSLHHASELGLGNDDIARQLAAIRLQVEMVSDQALDASWRNYFAQQMNGITGKVSELAKAQQPNFRPGPDAK